MPLLIQHGFGKSDKIDIAIEEQVISGAILAPRNEKPSKLEQTISQFREIDEDCEILIDPQFYISTIVPPNDGLLPEYDYYKSGKTIIDFTSRRNRNYVRETIDRQIEFGVDGILSPTIMFDSFSDRWYQTAINLADESIGYHSELDDPPPLYLSFIIPEQALSSETDIDLFLDTVTQQDWTMDGFYLTIAREERAYSQKFDADKLAKWLYVNYVLGELNGLRVICGYSDFVGIALRSVGADSFATGWWHSLRQFHKHSFKKTKGGGSQPRLRYSSGPLCNSILLSELEEIDDIGMLDSVLSGVPLDSLITEAASFESSEWNRKSSENHHWQVLDKFENKLVGDVEDDVNFVIKRLKKARLLYRELLAEGVSFENNTNGDHIPQWIKALQSFQKQAGFESA